jgi:acid phosphatase
MRVNEVARRAATSILAMLALVLASCAVPPPPSLPDLAAVKHQLRAYYQDGDYDRKLTSIAAEAEAYLVTRAKDDGRLAIVLDIDETALSSWPSLRANDFGFIPSGPCERLPRGPCGWTGWVARGEAPPIVPTLNLYRAARSLGYDVFFITGRREAARAATTRNLRSAGYDGWAGLVMKPNSGTFPSAADFKAPARHGIIRNGYRIVLNMGDQESDLVGGYADHRIRLPNPFYQVP